LSADLSRAYELLGVKPGVSSRELKAAHRDLAKVWHPDRFLHDPRLQEKAQEKLKEINEAYELLRSGRTPRPARTPPPERTPSVPQTETARSTPRGAFNWKWIAVPLFIFVAVFSITIRTLLERRSHALPPEEVEQAEQPVNTEKEASTQADSYTRPRPGGAPAKECQEDLSPQVASTDTQVSAPTPAVATVTVMVDPESGLLARPDCPLRSRMTYPSGSAPNGYCKISHAPPLKESRVKSLAKRIQGLQ
jgi:hypothetical protein